MHALLSDFCKYTRHAFNRSVQREYSVHLLTYIGYLNFIRSAFFVMNKKGANITRCMSKSEGSITWICWNCRKSLWKRSTRCQKVCDICTVRNKAKELYSSYASLNLGSLMKIFYSFVEDFVTMVWWQLILVAIVFT